VNRILGESMYQSKKISPCRLLRSRVPIQWSRRACPRSVKLRTSSRLRRDKSSRQAIQAGKRPVFAKAMPSRTTALGLIRTYFCLTLRKTFRSLRIIIRSREFRGQDPIVSAAVTRSWVRRLTCVFGVVYGFFCQGSLRSQWQALIQTQLK
jgi:hypothetical protein